MFDIIKEIASDDNSGSKISCQEQMQTVNTCRQIWDTAPVELASSSEISDVCSTLCRPHF